MLKIYFSALILLGSSVGFSQSTTVTFKPNAAIGEDAWVQKVDDDCIFAGTTVSRSNLNYGTDITIDNGRWTFNTVGCGQGTLRAFLRFSQLSTIPSTATIISAKLKLYGSATRGYSNFYNTYYPGSSEPTNEMYLQRVTGSWSESTITANTQPTTTSVNQVEIPATGSLYNWDYENSSINLKAQVQYMVSNPAQNYGFMMRQQIEEIYRSAYFASSDNADPTKWPELIVTYSTSQTGCNANFSYTTSTSVPNTFSFAAEDNVAGYTYSWVINGTAFSGPNVMYTFGDVASINACLTVNTGATTCTICHDIPTGTTALGKDLQVATFRIVNMHPNPTKNSWRLEMETKERMNISVDVYDVAGKKVLQTQNSSIQNGAMLEIDAATLASGIYLVVLKDMQSGYTLRKKGVKL